MQERLAAEEVDALFNLLLVPQLENIVIQPRLLCADQPRQGNRRLHIGQGVVGVFVGNAVGLAERFKAEGDGAGFGSRPVDAFRPRGGAEPGHVDDVPARIAAAPFVFVGVKEVAVEQLPGEFVVEADVVVAGDAGSGPGEFFPDAADEFCLADALFERGLRRDAGNQAGHGVGQEIRRRAAIQHERLAHRFELLIGAQAGELGRPAPARVAAESLEIVPVDRISAHLAIAGESRWGPVARFRPH